MAWFAFRRARTGADPAPRHQWTPSDRRLRMILTPEGVSVPLIVASRGARAAALLIDLFLISATMIATTLLLIWLGAGMSTIRDANKESALGRAIQALIVLWFIAMFLFRNVWFIWFELGPRGATPGKRIVGIRVAGRASDGGGGRLTTEAVIARNLLRDIELLLPLTFIIGAVSAGTDVELAGWAGALWFAIFALFPFFNRDGLRCGDVIAGTWVVEAPRRKLAQALSVSAAATAGRSTTTGAQYHFAEAELAIYGEYELQVLEQVLRDNRPEALAEVAAAICRKIGWNAGSGDERAFLDAYYTQLRARLESGMRFGKRKASKFDG